ncbi:MAG: phosphatidate cytidylyltransferase [Acidimicrobiales bacterium]
MDEPENKEPDQAQDRTAAEGVRIIGAEEAAEALESGYASGRQPVDAPRYGDVPPAPPGPRLAHRFPLPASMDPAQAVPRPPLARDAGVPKRSSEGDTERLWYGPGSGPGPAQPEAIPTATPSTTQPPTPTPTATPSTAPTPRPTPYRAPSDPDSPLSPTEAPVWVPSPSYEPPGGPVSDFEARRGSDLEGDAPLPPSSPAVELPHWADPPTGEVPRIFMDDPDDPDQGRISSSVPVNSPTWRDEHSGWDDDYEPSLLADDDLKVGAMDDARADRFDPYAYEDEAVPEDYQTPSGVPFDDEDYETYEYSEAGIEPRRRRQSSSHLRRGSGLVGRSRRGGRDQAAEPSHDDAPEPANSTTLRWTTGLGIGMVAIILLILGPVTALLLVLAVVFLAQAECYAVLRRAGYRPASLLGLVATVAIMVAAYVKGETALPLVLVLTVIFAMLWYLAGVIRGRPTVNMAVTLFGFVWVGFLGSFGALLLDPRTFPHRHGVAFLFGAIMTTVGYDVGAYVIGGRFGRRHIAPNISPNKTLEGLIGGMVLSVVSGAVIVSQFHPWTIKRAIVLGLVVAVVAPLGDLCESMIKRDIGVKDMGQSLPGHGGVLDRFDAMLFVLPATYYLLHVLNIA